MNLKQTIDNLQKIYDEHGDIPVVMYAQEGSRYTAFVIEEIKPTVFPPVEHKLDGITRYYVAALINDGLL